MKRNLNITPASFGLLSTLSISTSLVRPCVEIVALPSLQGIKEEEELPSPSLHRDSSYPLIDGGGGGKREMVSDSELVDRLREILGRSDLDKATAGSVRRQLEEEFGVDLSDRKGFIREQIDAYLQSMENAEEEEEEGDGDEDEEGVEEDEKESRSKW